jgi:CheY-like chemotaxis protein
MPRFGNRIYIWQAGAYENCEFKMARIMVVDDNDDVRKLTSRILEADGHEITEAENGLECLKKLKKALYPN